jgi:hypothetical protein
MLTSDIRQLVDLDRYPLDQPDSREYAQLLRDGRAALAEGAQFSMVQFVRARDGLRSELHRRIARQHASLIRSGFTNARVIFILQSPQVLR